MQLLQMFHKLFPPSRLFDRLKSGLQLACVGLAVILTSSLSACSQSTDEPRSTRRAIAQSQAVAADFLRTELALSPETASRLNLERYLGPSANSALDNHSQAGFERRRLVRIELLQRLQSRPRLSDEHRLTRDLEIATRALSDLISLEQLGYGRFDYSALRPYAIDPYSGIWIDGPNLLAYRQSINSADQAAAYLARMRALSAALQDIKRRLIADQASGIVLPRPLVTETRNRLVRLIEDETHGLTRLTDTFDALTRNISDLDEERQAHLVSLVSRELDDRLRPAYAALIATLDDVSGSAADQAGIWAQPRGQDLFSGILMALMGEQASSVRLHENHLENVSQRRQALSQMMTINAESATAIAPKPERLLDQFVWFEAAFVDPGAAPLEAPAQVDMLLQLAPKTLWKLIEDDPSFTAQADALGQFQSFMQTSPYQVWRTSDQGALPPHRKIVEYLAIKAGWQHYVWERAAPNISTETDAVSAIAHHSVGLIQSVMAAADTGIHLNRWTLAEATDYIAVNAGLKEPLARQLALTIAARPGYHSAVATIRQRLDALSERAQAVLGEQYSETDFQRTLIEPGPRPLPLIERDVEAWYGARLAAQSSN